MIADLHAPASEQGDAPAQIRQLGALGEIESGTGRAQLIVEMMDQRVFLLAHITMLQLDRFTPGHAFVIGIDDCIALRREIVLRGEYRLVAQLADAGCVEQGIVLAEFRVDARALGSLHALAA